MSNDCLDSGRKAGDGMRRRQGRGKGNGEILCTTAARTHSRGKDEGTYTYLVFKSAESSST